MTLTDKPDTPPTVHVQSIPTRKGTYHITLRLDSSKFVVTYGNETKTFSRLDEAREFIEKSTKVRRARISVSGSDRGRNFTVVGMHATSGKWLVHYEDGERSDAYSWYGAVGRPLTPAEKDERKLLAEAVNLAQRNLLAWESAHSYPKDEFRKMVESAWTAALNAAKEEK